MIAKLIKFSRRLIAASVACLSLHGAAAMAADIVNQASADYSDTTGAVSASLQSNSVTTAATLPAPSIQFFTDANYGRETQATTLGSQLFMQITAAACNRDANAIETLSVTVRSQLTGDVETFIATETAPGSSSFRITQEVWTANGSVVTMPVGDAMLQVQADDALEAAITSCGDGGSIPTAQTRILIDPAGVVFDSQTNTLIAGAKVQLIDVTGAGNGGNAGGPATVFAADGITPAPSSVITGSDGRYQFPLVAPSLYRLVVTPPGDYRFPSQLAPAQLPVGRELHLYGSYGADFPVNTITGPVTLDLPLDANPSGLFLQKTVSRRSAEIAESVEYTLILKNVSGLALDGVMVSDDLPAGFAYVSGSTRLNEVSIADPQGGKGPALNFTLGALAEGGSASLTYRVMIGPGALQGDGVNRAQATSTSPARKQSNVATATVSVQGGVFDDRAYVLGKIYADCNANQVQDAGEPGIPKVRLYMEDGSFVISDGEGKYSFAGLSPSTHVLKVDATTLPSNATLAAISHRNAGDGNSRFLDVKRGELHRADFATAACTTTLLNAIALGTSNDNASRELERTLKVELQPERAATASGDARSLPASGTLNTTLDNTIPMTTPSSPSIAPTAALEDLLPDLTSELNFIDLQDGDAVAADQISIRIKGMAQARIDLAVNGTAVADDRIGKRAFSADNNIELREYIGIRLKADENTLTLTQYDHFGNVRTTRSIRIIAPGKLARVTITPSNTEAAADGNALTQLHLRLEDDRGLLVRARTPVTLSSSLGEWQVSDLDNNTTGVQTFVENGAADFSLRAPLTPGDAQVQMKSGELSAETRVSFAPPLRPLLAVGVIEGVLNLRKLDINALKPARANDGFEQELTEFSRSNGNTQMGARAALFLKGKVAGKYLLTLGYDSDKDTKASLFRDIEPERFYPVYGDASIKGYDAQSTGRLYVRVDRNKSYLLLGDYTTQAINDARNLGAYNRSLNGVREHLERGKLSIDAFASRDSTRQVVEEIPANGTSGPYALKNGNAIENSQRVELLTRDRNQPSIVLKTVPLQRSADYELDVFTGEMLMRAPVPSVDADLNPISIRITYEVTQGGEAFWTSGVDSQFKLNERYTFGAAIVDDRNPVDATQLASTNATVKLNDKTRIVAETARLERDSTGASWGQRLELRHEDQALQLRVFAAHTDADFDNPSAGMSRGRTEAGAKSSYRFNDRIRLLGEALHTEDTLSGATRDGALLGMERSFDHNVKLELGVREVHATSSSTVNSFDSTTLRTKVAAPIPNVPQASVYGELEQDVRDTDRRMAAVGGEYQLANRGRLYLRHEFITSLDGLYALDATQRRNTTVFGVDTPFMHDSNVFSEYRIDNSLSGREAEAAMGLRNRWTVADGLRLNTSFERVQAVSGSNDNDSTALTGALEYTRNPLWKGTTRLELRSNNTSRGLLSTMGLARKLSEDWTLLGKNLFAITDYKTQPDKLQERLQLGVAYRDSVSNRVNALGRYEFKHEQNSSGVGARRNVHIVSSHVNYQPSSQWVLSGQYAGKLVAETIRDTHLNSNAHLLGARVTRDLGTRWDIGFAARTLFSGKLSNAQSAIGAEAGYLLKDNLWTSIGYNVTGFRDEDLSGGDYTDRGAYLRLRFKFDETLFGAT